MVSVFKLCSSNPSVNPGSQVFKYCLRLVCFKLAGVVSPLVMTGEKCK